MFLGLPVAILLAPPDRPKIYVEGFAGFSIVTLGSEDHRYAHGGAIGIELHAPRRFRYRNTVPTLIIEGYHHRSRSPGASGEPRNATDAYGVLQLLRYEMALGRNFGYYFDLGMGLQYADQRTVDLSGRLSSTPTLGLGLSFRNRKVTYFMGVRMFHVSNAGLQGNNQGQNQFMYTFGVRF